MSKVDLGQAIAIFLAAATTLTTALAGIALGYLKRIQGAQTHLQGTTDEVNQAVNHCPPGESLKEMVVNMKEELREIRVSQARHISDTADLGEKVANIESTVGQLATRVIGVETVQASYTGPDRRKSMRVAPVKKAVAVKKSAATRTRATSKKA